jgi:5'-deoxynucleotidase YfbR-like HD superfamily hydrolase
VEGHLRVFTISCGYFETDPMIKWIKDLLNIQDRGPTIRTRTGKLVHPLKLFPDELDIHDIAWGLSGEGRFTNHGISHFSVAQHSTLMASMAEEYNLSNEVIYQCLMHDADEAYLGDMAGPLKAYFPEWKKAEEHAWKIIAEKFHINPIMDPWVKNLDNISLESEKEYNLYEPEKTQSRTQIFRKNKLVPVNRKQAFLEFLRTYEKFRPYEAPAFDEKLALDFVRQSII